MPQAICITALEDGSFEVEPKDESYEEPAGGEMGAADMAEDKAEGQTFGSIDEALEAAKAMLTGGPTAEKPVMMEGESDFSQGFKSVRGSPEEQMAAGRRA